VTPAAGGRAWVALGIALSAAFAILAHAALVEGMPPSVGAAISVVPLALLALLGLRRLRQRELAAVGAVAAIAALWLAWPRLERHFPDVLFLEHACTNLAFAVLFGRTLLAAREPLVTTFARLVHGELPPEVARYTRGATIAWTLFFAAMFTASTAVYLASGPATWSVLANFVTPVAVVSMFVVEYALRHRLLPHWQHVGIMGGVRAFSRHFSQRPAS
jgi:uncharacterized membrane protein